MKKNEATWDRALRVILGVGLVSWAVVSGTAWAYVGIVPLATGLIGNCPVYSLLGISTCPLKDKAP